MKLTIKDRNLIYKAALNLVQNGWEYKGFCWALSRGSLVAGFPYVDAYHKMRLFPEIKRQQPKRFAHASYWFKPHMEKDRVRERILKQAIKDTNPKKDGTRRVSKGTSVSPSRKTGKGKRNMARVAKRTKTTTR